MQVRGEDGALVAPKHAAAGRRDGLVLGIDASNIRAGGGITHLSRLLAAGAATRAPPHARVRGR